MSAVANRLLAVAQTFTNGVYLHSESEKEVTLLFDDTPSYDQQLQLQRVVLPDAEICKTVRMYHFSFEGKIRTLHVGLV